MARRATRMNRKNEPKVEVETVEEVTETAVVPDEVVEELKQPTPTKEVEAEAPKVETEPVKEVKQEPAKKEVVETKIKDSKSVSTALAKLNTMEGIKLGKTIKSLKPVADTLSRFVEIGKQAKPEEYVRHLFSVYTSIKNVLANPNTNEANMQFRFLLNILCKAKKENIITETMFLKYDYKWQWGGAEYDRYSKLITVIYIACERGIKKVQGVVDLERIVQILPENSRNNFKHIFF